MNSRRPGCFNCDLQQSADPPPRDRVLSSAHWWVGHAFNVTQPGWLVLVPTRHVTAMAELSDAEAAELGPLIRDLSRALATVTGCVKTYQMQFSEAEGYEHLHVHLVPRLPEQPPEATGPAVFSLMTDDESQWLPEHHRDEIARAVRAAMP